jgi:hypothetical protein
MSDDGATLGLSPSALLRGLRGWPLRRWVAAAVVTVPLAGLYLTQGPSADIWWSVPAALVCGALASLVLASYLPLPGSGRWIDLGCSPCATVAAMTVLGSFILRDGAPSEVGMSLLAALMLVFGLVQRLSGGGVCAVPVIPTRPSLPAPPAPPGFGAAATAEGATGKGAPGDGATGEEAGTAGVPVG